MAEYWDSDGLLNCDKVEEFGENSFLFSVYYLTLTNDLELKSRLLDMLMGSLLTNQGLYKNIPRNNDYISHDNLTAICAMGLEHSRLVLDELLRQGGRYDNVNPQKPSWSRFMPLQFVLWLGIRARGGLWWLGFPVLAVMAAFSCFRRFQKNEWGYDIPNTSGKLLWWLRCKSMQEKVAFRLLLACLSVIIKHNSIFGSWYNVFLYYFKNDTNHPIVREMEKL